MNREKLIGALRQIEILVAECLRAVGDSSKPVPSGRKPKPNQQAGKNALPERILELRDKGFFPQPKTAREVQAKLNPVYSCEVDRVMMALLRLNERKQLRKASKVVDGKRQVAYVW
jgi:hypothetical protein